MDAFLDHVCGQLRSDPSVEPKYTLVLGAGFSHGVIPTTKQMVLQDIPWWLYTNRPDAKCNYTSTPEITEEFQRFASELWQQTRVDSNNTFLLNSDGMPSSSIPDNIANAYQWVMRPEASLGLSRGDKRRKYLRDVIHKGGNHVNAAHLFLSAILAAQEQWNERSPFCRTIFTTNFDPLLQRSLQLAGVLYTLTDRPHALELPDDLRDSAVHLIYTHGTVYQHRLINTNDEIAETHANAEQIKSYIRRRGVIVIGYGGWPDALMEAMNDCSTFDGNLFWCDRNPLEALDSNLRRNVRDLLESKRSSAFHVQIPSADELMLELHDRLGLGRVPAMLSSPISRLKEQVQTLHLSGLSLSRQPRDVESQDPTATSLNAARTDSLEDFKDLLLRRLENAERASKLQNLSDPAELLAAIRDNLLSDAITALTNGNYEDAVNLLNRIIENPESNAAQRARALLNRGLAFGQLDQKVREFEDYSASLAISDAPYGTKSVARFNLALSHSDSGRYEDAIREYTIIIDTPETTAELRSKSLINRGYDRKRKCNDGNEVSDFDAALAIPRIPIDTRSRAVLNRAISHLEDEEFYSADRLLTSVIGNNGVPADVLGKLLLTRATAKLSLGEQNAQLEDLTAVISNNDIPARIRSTAFARRADLFVARDETEKAIKDLDAAQSLEGLNSKALLQLYLSRARIHFRTGAIEEGFKVLDDAAKTERFNQDEVATVLFHKGVAFLDMERFASAIEQFDCLIQSPGTPRDILARAFINRGLAFGGLGKAAEETSDYRALLSLEGVSPSDRVKAHINLTVDRMHEKDSSAALKEIEKALKIENCPAELKASALVLKGKALRGLNRTDEAIVQLLEVGKLKRSLRTDRSEALKMLAEMYSEKREFQKAEAFLNTSIEDDKADCEYKSNALNKRGLLLGWRGNHAGELADALAIIKLDKADATDRALAHLNSAAAQIAMGQYLPAIDHLKNVIAFKGKWPKLIMTGYALSGTAYALMGMKAESERKFKFVSRMSAKDAEANAVKKMTFIISQWCDGKVLSSTKKSELSEICDQLEFSGSLRVVIEMTFKVFPSDRLAKPVKKLRR